MTTHTPGPDQVFQLLAEIRAYFDDQADADQPAGCDHPIPNEAMRWVAQIDAEMGEGIEIQVPRVTAAFRACRDLPPAFLASGKLAEVLAAFRQLTKDISELIGLSEGVYGLHLNGDPSPWSDLLSGGRYEEWLASLEVAERLLSELPAAAEKAGG